MAILLIFLSALLIFIGFNIKSNTRLAFIQSFIVICFISYSICELFSINNSLTASNIAIGWLFVIIGSIVYLLKHKSNIVLKNNILIEYYNNADVFSRRLILAIILFIIIPLLLLAIFIPPNNWDSMAYHMPRVMHWIQDKNIYPYPTNIYRQVLTSPLSEYVILNLQVLAGNDTFANLVQFSAFIAILFAVSLLVQLMGIGRKGQLFILLLVISLPMALFQSTTTQTDLLASFFFIGFVYYTAAFIKKQGADFSNILFATLSIALGILTKYNVAIFSLPIALYLLVHLLKTYPIQQVIKFTSIVFLIALIVLVPFIGQNIYFFGSATGKAVFDSNASIISDKISIQYMISNNIKLLADFVSIPVDAFNKLIHISVTSLHKIIGVSENDPGNNWAGEAFTINNHLNEDTAGSLFHFGWILLSVLFLFKSKLTRKRMAGILYFIFSFSLFSLLFIYSAFNFRLLLPLVLLLLTASGIILFKQLENTKWINPLMVLLFLVALLPVYFNRAKPIIADPFYLKRVLSHSPKQLIGSKSIFHRTQLDHYFAQNPILQSNLVSLFDSIPQSNNKLLLSTEFDSYEYLVWILAKEKFKNGFYIGYLVNDRYKSHWTNVQSPGFFNTQLIDRKSHWSIITNK